MALEELAARLAAAADELSTAAATLPGQDPGAHAFGAAAAGRLGALGHELHRACLVALDARAREAGAHAARLSDLADSVARAATRYAAADDAARLRHRESP
jgi:hypothetical protein